MENLRMDPDFAERGVNVGFSGGEKKRLGSSDGQTTSPFSSTG